MSAARAIRSPGRPTRPPDENAPPSNRGQGERPPGAHNAASFVKGRIDPGLDDGRTQSHRLPSQPPARPPAHAMPCSASALFAVGGIAPIKSEIMEADGAIGSAQLPRLDVRPIRSHPGRRGGSSGGASVNSSDVRPCAHRHALAHNRRRSPQLPLPVASSAPRPPPNAKRTCARCSPDGWRDRALARRRRPGSVRAAGGLGVRRRRSALPRLVDFAVRIRREGWRR